MKKPIDSRKLVLTTKTITVLDLARTAGGQKDPTLGVCGTSRNTHCPSQINCG